MTKVIFDTSSLVRFIDFSYRFDYSKLEEPPVYLSVCFLYWKLLKMQ